MSDETLPPPKASGSSDAMLTPALQAVLQLLVQFPDENVDEIAARLFKSPATVRTQIQEIQKRLNAPTRAAIVARAWEWDLTPKPNGSPIPRQANPRRSKRSSGEEAV